MANNGKQLEGLIAFVEKTLLPQGFEVKTNELVYNDEGVQIAEFDIEAKGKLGTTEIAWLIECRDRPSQGPAPGSWIEQLVGRRSRFGFNKVTAVSTTGFASGAEEYAQNEGIELREVQSLSPEAFADWLGMGAMQLFTTLHKLDHAKLLISPEESEERQQLLLDILKKMGSDKPLLRSAKTGKVFSIISVFTHVVSENPDLSKDLKPNHPAIPVKLDVTYVNDHDHFVVDTPSGAIRIVGILFTGELSVKLSHIPVETSQYSHSDTGDVISQLASFPFSANNQKVSLEMHRIPESGFTHIVFRKLGSNLR